MSKVAVENNVKPDYDKVMLEIADYVGNYQIVNSEAYDIARLCLFDALSCGLLALNFPECTKLLGPIVPNATLVNGARVPGTDYQLDPIQAAFNIGTMLRWLDFNDTWLAAEWGHPSDNLGAILALSDYLDRSKIRALTMYDVLTAMIKAYEIQGCFALENSFNAVGLDHVILVKLASAAVAAQLLGADKQQVLRTLSQVFVDGQSLRTYRHAPNTGSRKSWAAGDATARGLRLAFMVNSGEMGYPSALSAPKWGFYDVAYRGNTFKFPQKYDSYVMENILFKIAYPAEFHAQTAVESAIALHKLFIEKYADISKIDLITHAAAINIISKQGRLYNAADRDHCLQYMVAVALLYGNLQAEYYSDQFALDPRIDILRSKMYVSENVSFSHDYYDVNKRSIANSVQLHFNDGSKSDLITIEYPLGHKRRRQESMPALFDKITKNLATRLAINKVDAIMKLMNDSVTLVAMPVADFMDLWQVANGC